IIVQSDPIANPELQTVSEYVIDTDIDFVKKISDATPLDIFKFKPAIFASELTYICETYFNKISSYHFINYLFDESPGKFLSENHSEINFLINLFELISNFVSYEIICADSVAKQISVVDYFIRVALKLNHIGNYHMLFSVLSGLNNM